MHSFTPRLSHRVCHPSLLSSPLFSGQGSGLLKAGIAGEDVPRCVMRSVVGEPKHAKVMVGAVESGSYVGEKAEEDRGVLKLRYPVEHGKGRRWGGRAQGAWGRGAAPPPPPPPPPGPRRTPRRARGRAAEVFFEQFNVPAFYVSMQAVLSLYASGQTTGLVVDSGNAG